MFPSAALVLGYVDGQWPTYDELRRNYADSSTHVLSVTVAGKAGADFADCEKGNIQPPQVAQWAKSELKAGRKPGIYGSKDFLDACRVELGKVRVRPSLVNWFLADYIQVAPQLSEVKWPRSVPSGYVGWQFADSIPVNGHTIDCSIVNRNFARSRGWGKPKKIKYLPLSEVVAHTVKDTLA